MSNEDPLQGDQLRSIVERIERLDNEIGDLNQDKKEVYAEAKGNGYDVKVLRKVVALRKRDLDERKEEEAILDLYLSAVGENRDVPAPSAQSRRIEAKGMDTAEDLYKAAVRLVQTDGKASTSYVQRRMSLGYNRAAGFMERMEKEGIVSAPDDAGHRTVLPVQHFSKSALDQAAKEFAQTMNRAGATVSIVAEKGSIFEAAGKAAQAAGAPVTLTERKPIVSSFTPPREDPFGASDE